LELGPWLRQVHIKDAVRTKTPGTWGEEVAVGRGQVNWREFLAALPQVGFSGPRVIEREAGSQRVADVLAARAILEKELCANEKGQSKLESPPTSLTTLRKRKS